MQLRRVSPALFFSARSLKKCLPVSLCGVFLCVCVCDPACQCNGHSKCVNESVCEKCEDLTTGRHCESCISGFYGDPTNGGSCQREYRSFFSLSAFCSCCFTSDVTKRRRTIPPTALFNVPVPDRHRDVTALSNILWLQQFIQVSLRNIYPPGDI